MITTPSPQTLFDANVGLAPNSAFGSYAMLEFGGSLVLGLSNSPGNDNGGMVAVLDEAGNLTAEHVVDEQGIHDIRVIDNDLFVVGTDPVDSWAYGNLYLRQNGDWEKIRTMPNVIHALGAIKDGESYLIATGAHTGDNTTYSGRIYKSVDLQSWAWQELGVTLSGNYYTYRVMDMARHGTRIYATVMWPVNSTRLLVSEDDGQTWQVVIDDITHSPAVLARFVTHGDYLCMLNQSLFEIVAFALDGSYLLIDLPSVNASDRFNVLASDGASLYVLDNQGDIWKTSDMSTWVLLCHIDNAISLGYWLSQGCLVVSDVGQSAKLWKIAL